MIDFLMNYLNIIIGILVFVVLFAFRNKLAELILFIIAKIFYNKKEEHQKALKESLKKPLAIFFVVLGIFIAVYINFQHTAILKTFKISTILIICWGIVCYISDNLSLILSSRNSDNKLNETAIKFISNILKVLIAFLGIVMVVSELGYNINGLITGLGVGGLAFSLAAQDSLQNLISGFVIIFDKPFEVGDLISTSDFTGNVEDITMRSTRIRKLDDTIIVVPNSVLADASITNFAKLTRKLVEFKVGLIYSTPVNELKKCENEIRDYLDNHEMVDSSTIRVCFAELEDSALNLGIRCYIDTTNIEEYYKFLEELNFEIKRIVEKNNTDFAYPSSSIYIEKSGK